MIISNILILERVISELAINIRRQAREFDFSLHYHSMKLDGPPTVLKKICIKNIFQQL
jgi:hypothetical protein